MTYDDFIELIWAGGLVLNDLTAATFLYEHTSTALLESLTKSKLVEPQKILEFRINLGRFSGAKTFHEAKLLTDMVYKDGKKKPFNEFKKEAEMVDNLYNKNWLKTEMSYVFGQGNNAQEYITAQEQKEYLPYLQYMTVGDERVRHSHESLNGIIRKVDDPFWHTYMPKNEWGCRCRVVQLEKGEVTKAADLIERTKEVNKEFAKNPMFANNPALVSYIFKEKGIGKHPYFKVPLMYANSLKNNFAWPLD
jgi:SPP1 gp7 family putative phage head morphogenesis protein